MITALRYRMEAGVARLRTKYLLDVTFVHINKTGGSSIESALGLPFRHCTARELRAELGERRWATRFSFAFVRNPWAKVASHYAYRVQTNQTGLGDGHLPFNEWVRLAYGEHDPQYFDQPKMFMSQAEWICDESGEVMVDFVGRFERLEADFRVVCERIGRQAQLPHLKRSATTDFRAWYEPDAAEIVAGRFAADLELFGYSFDTAASRT